MATLMELMENDPGVLSKKLKNPNMVIPEPESVRMPSLEIRQKRPPLSKLIGEENNPLAGDDAEILRQYFKLARSG